MTSPSKLAFSPCSGIPISPQAEVEVYVTAVSVSLSLTAAERPRWSGREDPREQVLCEVYGLLLGAADGSTTKLRAVGT